MGYCLGKSTLKIELKCLGLVTPKLSGPDWIFERGFVDKSQAKTITNTKTILQNQVHKKYKKSHSSPMKLPSVSSITD